MKVGKYNQINEYMMLYDNPRSVPFIDLCPRSLRLNIFKLLFLKNIRPFESKIHLRSQWDVGMKIYSNVQGHMTKMASMPIYGKIFKKSPSSEPRG